MICIDMFGELLTSAIKSAYIQFFIHISVLVVRNHTEKFQQRTLTDSSSQFLQIATLQIDVTTANFTGDGQQKTVEQLDSYSGLSTGLHGHLTFLSDLNSFLSVTALLGNFLILIALHKESSLHPPSKLLLRSLATTDLCVCLLSEPLAVIYWILMSSKNEDWNIHLSLHINRRLVGRQCFVWSVSDDNDCNKRRQTSRPVVETEIQRSCNFGKNLRDRNYLMVVSAVFSAMQLRNRLITIWYGIIHHCVW